MPLSRWVYLIREMDKKRSINDIAKDLDLTYKTVLGMSRKVKEAIYDRREEWLDPLTGEVEADDVHVKGGQQGREVSEEEDGRAARTRGFSERGRGSYEGDRPLVVSWVERGEKGPRVFELRRTAGKKSLVSSALSHVEEGSEVNTSRVERIPAARGDLRSSPSQTQRALRQRRGSPLQHGRK